MAGGADLGFSLHAGGLGTLGRADALEHGAVWLAPAAQDEWMIAEVPAPGIYCLAVWKRGHADVGLNVQYKLDFLTVTDAPAMSTPARTALVGNHPNPFNPRTTISFEMQRESRVELTIYNSRGTVVRRLLSGARPAGRHDVLWDGVDDAGRPVATGVYLVQLTAEGVQDRRKVLLLK